VANAFGKLVHYGTKGQLIAEIRYSENQMHVRATKLGRAGWWFRIRLNKKQMIVCECGGTVKDHPNEMKYDEKWGGCSHIVALYKGNVTSDERSENASMVLTQPFSLGGRAPIHFGRLSELGKKLFYWRWIALKLGPEASMGSS
jgi:hypothetical protein